VNRPRRKYAPFNPFIVLSDVTISTLVVLACLLMVFSVGATSKDSEKQKLRDENSQLVRKNEALETEKQQLTQEKQRRLKAIQERQEALVKGMSQKFKDELPTQFGVSYARGDSTFLVRFFDQKMFASGRPDAFSERGARALAVWVRHVGPILERQARESARMGMQEPGGLIEIQVRGHCRPSLAPKERLWAVSLNRAQAAVRIFDKEARMPTCLLSVTGMAHYRPAFQSTDEYVENRMKEYPEELGRLGKTGAWNRLELWGSLPDGTPIKKPGPFEDRLDILVLYSGGERQNNYVQAVDGPLRFGLPNDTSSPELSDLNEGQ
jgi:flagellar motor protein MotB